MEKESNLTENRFLDLECVPDFQIQETQKQFNEANLQKANKILNELLTDPKVKGEIRKKILDTTKLLDEKDD